MVDGLGNAGATLLIHIGFICVKVGVSLNKIVTLNNAVSAQIPGVGVKIYPWVPTTALEITAGDHVPVIEGVFVEAAANAGTAPFWQMGGIALKVGLIGVFTITVVVLGLGGLYDHL